jgi:thioredoxin-related protein
MKLLSVFLLSFFLTPGKWLTNFEEAKQESVQSHKYILLNFSGSDWCGPCIRMHKEIFEANAFQNFANDNLVLVNADFPRQKKHQLEKTQQLANDKLAEQYNPQGKFPYTVLINENGKVVKQWEGMPDEKPEQFVAEVNTALHAGK